MKNRQIADMFERIADVLEFQGEMPFKINAYRRAARALVDMPTDIETLWKEGRLRNVPGVGEALAKKMDEFLRTGRMSKFEEATGSVPSGLIDLLGIQSLGPKTLALAHKKLGIQNITDLKRVVEDGSLTALPGMGPKKVENIRKGMELREKSAGCVPLGRALNLVEEIVHRLKKHPGVGRMDPAGSLRRMRETVGDIDILAETKSGESLIRTFVSLPMVTRVLAAGSTKGSVLVEGGIQVDLRAVDSDSYGAALQYFTGSKEHNVRIRELAKKRGLKVNEYGLFDRNEKRLGGRTEEWLYERLGMPWIPPELREDNGEIENALENKLPDLVALRDVLGDLHVHTEWSDGRASIGIMAQKAKALGYRYLAVCDHSQSAGYANGLTPERLEEQVREIGRINRGGKGFRVLAGTEVDIRTDGTLDFPDTLLSKLDIVVAAVHSGFKKRVTERLISAANHPLVDVLAHPTGRLISKREGYEVNIEAVMKACAETGTAMEINAWFERLDLSDVHARRAGDMGVKLAIGTDAHEPGHMDAMRLGIGVARRAWLEKGDVLNCRSWEKRKPKH